MKFLDSRIKSKLGARVAISQDHMPMTGFFQAFFDGFTGGNLMSWAEMPGAAEQVFATENSGYPQRGLMETLLRQQAEEETLETEGAPSVFYADCSTPVLLSRSSIGRMIGTAPTQIRAIQLARDLRTELGDEEAIRFLHRTIKEMKPETHGT